jgi:uncharacterized protein YdhG (YjbR/CyaY superfamily)
MKTDSVKAVSINEYILQQDKNIQTLLQQMRVVIQKAAPKATEVISYGMPAFKQQKVLVYFAGYKKHIGFYPHSSPIIFFAAKLKIYKTSKGAIQFPLDKPLPIKLITDIVKYRIKEDAIKK